jgi:hypothetical protein
MMAFHLTEIVLPRDWESGYHLRERCHSALNFRDDDTTTNREKAPREVQLEDVLRPIATMLVRAVATHCMPAVR